MTGAKQRVRVLAARARRSWFVGQVVAHSGGRIVAALLSALWLVVAARQLPLDAFGDLSVLLSLGAMLIVVGDLGYPFALAREVARTGAISKLTVIRVVRRRAAAGALAAIAVGIAYVAVAHDTRLLIPVVFAVSVVATLLHSSLFAALRGLGLFRWEATSDVLSRLGVLVIGGATLSAGGGLAAAVTVYAAADVASLVLGAAVLRRRLSDDDDIDPLALSLRRTGPLAIGRLALTLYYRVDVWLLALLAGPPQAALYAAPYRILDGLLLFPRAVGAVSVTRIGRAERAGRAPDGLGWPVWMGVAPVALAAAVLAAFAEPVLRLTFGTPYAVAAAAFVILLASAVPGAFVSALLPVVGLQTGRWFLASAVGVVVANVALNLALIPTYGRNGAAVATLVCQAGLALLLWRGARRAREKSSTGSPPFDVDQPDLSDAGPPVI